jgi:DsbC/DsbD-like thiol-disulfide interchange protein
VIRAALAVAVSMTLGASVAGQSFFKNQPARLTVDARVEGTLDSPARTAHVTLVSTPVPGVHVYAPGNPDYIAVSVAITPLDGLTIGAPEFPAAEPYFFAPLKQAVKVYSKPFTVRIPVKATASFVKDRRAGPADPVVLKGVVSYQACDDKVCFPPQTLSFTANVRVRK